MAVKTECACVWCGAHLATTYFHHFGFLFRREQVGNFGRVEQRVDVLQERLLFDLRVGDEERRLLVVHARRPEQVLEVFAPLVLAVILGDLRLEDYHAGHEGRQAGERLPPAASDADEQRVTASDAQHAADARQVFQHVPARRTDRSSVKTR